MSRIRYNETDTTNTTLCSVKTYHHPSNGARYKVMLDTTNNAWTIVDDASRRPAATGVGVNLHKTKIAAREALLSLGISLAKESRNRKTAA